MVFLLLVSVLFQRPLTFIILVGGIGGRGGIKMESAKNNQLISSQGPHFSPRSTAKTNGKSTNLRKNGIYSGTSEERPTWDRAFLPLFGGWSLLEVNPFYI